MGRSPGFGPKALNRRGALGPPGLALAAPAVFLVRLPGQGLPLRGGRDPLAPINAFTRRPIMQKVRLWDAIVRRRLLSAHPFQRIFKSVTNGRSFHLSLTVLVHYRFRTLT